MALYLPTELWTLILKHASGFPRPDNLLRGQHLKAALKPVLLDTTPSHKNVNGTCTSCALHQFDQRILVTASMVAKQCYDGATSLLYREPIIPTEGGCILFLRTITERPALAAHVRWLPLLDFHDAQKERMLPVAERRLPPIFIQRHDELSLAAGDVVTTDYPAPRGLSEQMCITTILSFLPDLRTTHVTHQAGDVGAGLSSDSLSSLTTVEISHVSNIFSDLKFLHLSGLAQAAPNISTLTLRDLDFSLLDHMATDEERLVFANVTCLCLVRCMITGVRFGNFMKSFPRLEQLDFLRPSCVFLGSDFTDALAQHTPHLHDLRLMFIDQQRNVMKLGKELAKVKQLQRLWLPFSCFVGAREDFDPEGFVHGLPTGLQHLSMMLSLSVEDLMSRALGAVAAEACQPDSWLQELRSVVVSGWDFDVGRSGATSRSFETEEAMVRAGRLMDANGVRLTVEGGIAKLEDHYMGFERVVRRYATGDDRETEEDEDLMKGHALGEWGTMPKWCRRKGQ